MFDLINLIILTILTISIFLLLLIQQNDKYCRLIMFIFIFSFFLYSGLGMAFKDFHDFYTYLIKYILYLLLFLLSIHFVFGKEKKTIVYHEFYENDILFLIFVSLIFYIVLLIADLYIVNNLHLIFSMPSSSAINMLMTRVEFSDNYSVKIIDFLKNMSYPFFLFGLLVISKSSKGYALLLLIFSEYLGYLKYEYISRNEMIKILFIAMMIYIKKTEFKNLFKIKYIICMVLVAIFLLPFFYSYAMYRVSDNFEYFTIKESFDFLLKSEASYPFYYHEIKNSLIKFQDYVLWLVFLPVPSFLWSSKPSIKIAEIFTEYILGLSLGDQGFYIVLPSLLGEAFMIFGQCFFWVHAIINGLIFGLIFKYFAGVEEYALLNAYLMYLFLFIGRTGTTIIPSFINIFIVVALFNIFIKFRNINILSYVNNIKIKD